MEGIPSFEVAWCPSESAYMSEAPAESIVASDAVSATPGPPQPYIFYPKKISPEIHNMLTEGWAQGGGQAFMAWWKRANQSREFWVETHDRLIRAHVHVVPRKHPFDPALWTTKYHRLKDALLARLDPSRITDFIPCLTEGVVLRSLTDMWHERVGNDPVGEGNSSTNAKLTEFGL